VPSQLAVLILLEIRDHFYRPVDTDEIKLFAGGYWAHAASCGSRCRMANVGRVITRADLGGRGKSKEL